MASPTVFNTVQLFLLGRRRGNKSQDPVEYVEVRFCAIPTDHSITLYVFSCRLSTAKASQQMQSTEGHPILSSGIQDASPTSMDPEEILLTKATKVRVDALDFDPGPGRGHPYYQR